MDQRERLIGIALKVFAQLVALPQTGTDEDRFYQAVTKSLLAVRGQYQSQAPQDSIQQAVQEQSMQSQPMQEPMAAEQPMGGNY